MRTGVIAAGICSCLATLAFAVPVSAQSNVSTYHNDAARSGMYIAPDLTPGSAATLHLDTGFKASVSGTMRSQLLFWTNPATGTGEVIVTTSDNNVAALNPVTGKAIWTRNLGAVPLLQKGKCSTGVTTGILGTPVIDPVAGIIYLNSYMAPLTPNADSGAPATHYVWALSLVDGSNIWPQPLDMTAAFTGAGFTTAPFNPSRQAARSAIALINGQLYIPYGSNSGECDDFRGWVGQVDATTGNFAAGWETRAIKGGIWGQGGVVSDGTSAFVATGNTAETAVWQDGETIWRLGPGLDHSINPVNYFVPVNWHELDANDLDLGGSNPVPINVPIVGGGTAQWLFVVGKDGTVYILNRGNLGGMGGSIMRQQVAVPEVATAPAVFTAPDGSGTFVSIIANGSACPTPLGSPGLVTLKIQATPSPVISTAWCQAVAAQGAPVVTTVDGLNDPIVWVEGAVGDGMVHGYDGVTGNVLFNGGTSADHLNNTRRWDALIWADSALYIGGTNHVYRFIYTPNQ
jgi:outer membrane protein assembly factor BamB